MDDAEKLRRAIEVSGLSARRFAREILIRDERTVRRWLAGDSPLPEAVRGKLDELLQAEQERSRRESPASASGGPKKKQGRG